MRHASAFAGVDAVGLAVRALGGETVAYSEFDPTPKDKKRPGGRLAAGPDGEQYNQRLLAKRLPEAEAHSDVRNVDWSSTPDFDFFSAGFPCQDLSAAGNGAGLDGDRSGLYVEVIRALRESRPQLALIENVPRLLGLHFERLLRDIDEIGYDCEWDVVSAAAVGGPHLRERLWILVYPSDNDLPQPRALGRPKRISKLKITDDGVKWPRAGMMTSGLVIELEPIAPRKTKRVDGRTYWVGVNLLNEATEQVLVPSPRATDGDRGGRGDLIQVVRGNSNGHFAQTMWPTPCATDHKGANPLDRRPECDDDLPTRVVRTGLWPTPTKQDGSNNGGPAQFERHSLPLNAAVLQGLWPTPHGMPKAGIPRVLGPSGNELGRAVNQGLWPTPERSDASGGRVSLDIFGLRPSGAKKAITLGTAVHHELFPTPTRADGEHGSEQGPRHYADGTDNPTLLGAARASLLPTPSASSYGSNQGGAAGRVGEHRYSLESMARLGLLPMPSRADGTGGPGTSDARTGGKNLRTEIAEQESDKGESGSLNPDWVEWMMALPIGWTDVDCDEPVYRPFWDEPLPRVVKECPNRRQRLQAIGNSLVWLIPYVLLSRYKERVGRLPGQAGVNLSVLR